MSLRRLGRKGAADTSVENVGSDLEIIENGDYFKLIKLYKGIVSGGALLDEFWAAPDNVSKASLGYGLGNRYLYHNKKEKASKIFRAIVAGKQWSSFGYIAAEADLKRLGSD